MSHARVNHFVSLKLWCETRGEIGPERSGAATQSFSQRRSSSSGSCMSQQKQKWLKLHSTVRVFLVLGRSKT